MLYAAGTVEEAEAANIRLCGAFFRQYLDPLASPFVERAVAAALHVGAAARAPAAGAAAARVCRGAVAGEFRRRVADAGVSAAEGEPPSAGDAEGPLEDASMPTATLDDDVASDGTKPTPPCAAKRPTPAGRDDAGVAAQAARAARPSPSTTRPRARRPRRSTRRACSARSRISRRSTLAWPRSSHKSDRRRRCSIKSRSASSPRKRRRRERGRRARLVARAHEVDHLPAAQHDGRAAHLREARGRDRAPRRRGRRRRCGARRVRAARAARDPRGDAALAEGAGRRRRLSRRKAEYVRALAAAFASGELSDDGLAALDDAAAMRVLMRVRGLGEWSVHMFLMFGLGRPDVLPVGDLAVQKAFKKLYSTNAASTGATQVNELPTRREMEALAEPWRPWRTVGSWYMWHVVETAAANWV